MRASPLCFGLIVASVGPASSDQTATLVEVVAHAYNPTQISALIAAAVGRVETGADEHSPSLEPLQETLDVSNGVAIALLRVLDRSDLTPDRYAHDLVESAIQYHAVLDGLAEMDAGNPTESQALERVRAGMTAGRFDDAEAELRQIEDRKVVAFGGPAGGSTAIEFRRWASACSRTGTDTVGHDRPDKTGV